MIHIVTDKTNRRLPFYLALEEWVARHMPPEEYLFAWRVEPTVIFGRNQNVAVEVNLEYCREHGIQVYRRRSGGGCVYADMDNLMISYITPSTDVTTTFASFTTKIVDILVGLGVPAETGGRNDIMIDGHKVSGCAFYHLPGRSIVHSTMLFSTNMEHMMNAITPSRSKLESKQVASVASRITTLKEYIPQMSFTDFEDYLYRYATSGEYVLSAADLEEVEKIESKYYELSWIFGKRGIFAVPKNQKRILRRVPGVGEMDILLNVDGGFIKDLDISGDFFLLSDLDSLLIDKIKGCELSAQSLAEALADTDVGAVISGLSTDDFIKLLTNVK